MRSILAGLRRLVIPWGSRTAPRIVLGTDDPLAVATFQDAAMVFYFNDTHAMVMAIEQDGFPDPETAGQLHIFAGSTDGSFLAQYLDCDYDVTLNESRCQVGANVDTLFLGSSGGGDVRILGDSLEIDVDDWHDMTLGNGWTDRAGHTPLQYRHTPTSEHVMILGQIVPGTLTNATVIATLPAGYRPPNEILILCRRGASAFCTLAIQSNGQIQIFDAAGSGATLVQIPPTIFPTDAISGL